MECDNNRVVTHGDSPVRGIKEKQVQTDALRSFKQLIMNHPFRVAYRRVKAHQDDVKNWEQLSLEERLNVIVDGIAKKVLMAVVVEQ